MAATVSLSRKQHISSGSQDKHAITRVIKMSCGHYVVAKLTLSIIPQVCAHQIPVGIIVSAWSQQQHLADFIHLSFKKSESPRVWSKPRYSGLNAGLHL